jgi:uncharacterized membrane protein YfcA
MLEYGPWELLAIALIYLIAGVVKGGIGLGLPTVSIGLMAIWLPVEQAAGILIIPVILTNIWQTFYGTALKLILLRFWTLKICLIFGSVIGAGLISGVNAAIVSGLLGVVLVAFAILGLTGIRFDVREKDEKLWNPFIGLTTGIISGATAIFVVPVVPYLQSINFARGQSRQGKLVVDPTKARDPTMERDALIQALGMTVLISSVALALGLKAREQLPLAIIVPGFIGTSTAIIGMIAGRFIRNKMSLEVFRRWVLSALVVLGGGMIARALS